MSKTKLIIAILLLSLVLSLFAGCQAQNGNVSNNEGTEPSSEITEPSSEATEPSDETPEPMFPLSTENIRAYIKEGITYEETIALFGRSVKDVSNDPIRYGSRIWFIGDCEFGPSCLSIIGGPYVEIVYVHPQWHMTSQDDFVFPGPGTWRLEMVAIGAAIYWEDGTEEILFGTLDPTDYLNS